MEFGRVTASQLERVDTSLPGDAPTNKLVLAGNGGACKIYMGTPKWGRKEWIGSLYPKGTKESNFLEQYQERYNAIEMNATHYQPYTPDEIAKWTAKIKNPGFKFCPKFWNQISHYSGFANPQSITNQFLEGMLAFGEHLGPIFLQVSEKYNTKQRDRLFSYLQSLPTDLPFFLEVRHPDWFGELKRELFDTLRALKIGAVITDTLGHREVAHMELTVPKAFIRFCCTGNHHSDITRIDAWVQRIKQWQENGLQECYFFVHTLNEGLSPQVTKYVQEQFNAICHAGLPEVKFANNLLF